MPFWSWTGTATQANAAGGVVVIDVTAGIGNVLQIMYARAVGSFALSDFVRFITVDEDNVFIAIHSSATATPTANTTFPRANTDVDSTTSGATVSASTIDLAGPDQKFVAESSAIAQNDTVQLLLWAWVKHGPGTISVARSTGSVAAPTVTVNEVY